MQRTTRSLLIAFGSAAALVAAPVVLEVRGETNEVVAVSALADVPPVAEPEPAPARSAPVAPPAVAGPTVVESAVVPPVAEPEAAPAPSAPVAQPAVAAPMVVEPAVVPPVAEPEVAPAPSAPVAQPAVAAPVVVPPMAEPGGAAPPSVPAVVAPTLVPAVPALGGESPAADGSVEAPADAGPGTPAPAPLPAGTGRGGDLPPELLPAPPYPQCPITEEGAWWTDPSDPYTCLRPGSVMFHEPTPPGIPPELLEPIFEDPETPPAPAEDCRVSGAMECVVDIMGQDYVVTFDDGAPVGVAEAQR